MADFVQTMKDWRRMCEHCDRNEKIGCVVNGNVCAGFCKMKDEIDLEVVEAKVTAWAAEHPEPVYPTWYEWLKDMGLTFHDAESSWIGFTERIHHPIPADIAQKMGIQPKEG